MRQKKRRESGEKEKRAIWGRVRNPNLFLGQRKILWRRSDMWTVNWSIVKNWPNKNVVGVGTHRGHTTQKDTGERESHNGETEKVWHEYVWKGEDQETKLRRKWGQTLGSLGLILERIFIALWVLKVIEEQSAAMNCDESCDPETYFADEWRMVQKEANQKGGKRLLL